MGDARKWSPEERIARLEERLQLRLPDVKLTLTSLTHKSWCNEHKDATATDNERLEFLGDAVVDLAISHRLMERFPNAREGELSRLRALVVNEEGLARVARQVGLGEFLILGKGEELTGGRDKNSVLADALEALIGAIYSTHGMGAALEFVDKQFTAVLQGVGQGGSGLDYKTRLQETAQNQLKVLPRYRIVGESGPDHSKLFEVEVTVGPDITAQASGRSKKEAEQAAAKAALALLPAKLEDKPGAKTDDNGV